MARHEASPAETNREPPDPFHDRPLGPGWFDSSWELRIGLEVREDLALDSRWPQCHAQTEARLVTAPADASCPDLERLGDLAGPAPPDSADVDAFSRFGIDGLELL